MHGGVDKNWYIDQHNYEERKKQKYAAKHGRVYNPEFKELLPDSEPLTDEEIYNSNQQWKEKEMKEKEKSQNAEEFLKNGPGLINNFCPRCNCLPDSDSNRKVIIDQKNFTSRVIPTCSNDSCADLYPLIKKNDIKMAQKFCDLIPKPIFRTKSNGGGKKKSKRKSRKKKTSLKFGGKKKSKRKSRKKKSKRKRSRKRSKKRY